jgi:uncharacterized protein YcbX
MDLADAGGSVNRLRISGLFIYPIKSGAAVALRTCDVDEQGLVGDREYMVVDADGRFLTQREEPGLALVAWDAPQVVTPIGRAPIFPGLQRQVKVWSFTGPAVDCGDDVAGLLSDYLGRPCRLVRTPATHARRSDDGRSLVGFSDGFPLLLTGEQSLAELNRHLPQPLPMDRFRPNVVVSGSAAFEEDTWREVMLGDLAAEVVKPCKRCAITRVDQSTGQRVDGEPLQTLARFRRVPGGVIFGQNVVHSGSAVLHVGDEVQVISRQAAPALQR